MKTKATGSVVPCEFPFKFEGETHYGCIDYIKIENGQLRASLLHQFLLLRRDVPYAHAAPLLHGVVLHLCREGGCGVYALWGDGRETNRLAVPGHARRWCWADILRPFVSGGRGGHGGDLIPPDAAILPPRWGTGPLSSRWRGYPARQRGDLAFLLPVGEGGCVPSNRRSPPLRGLHPHGGHRRGRVRGG